MNKLIEALKPVLEEDEGKVNSIYLDHLGYPTFGIGHLVKKDDPEYGQPVGTPVSEERIWEVFEKDVQTCIWEAYEFYAFQMLETYPLEVQVVIASLLFQLGAPRYTKFKKHIAAMREKDYIAAARELKDSRLYRQTTARTERHMERLINAT